MDNTERNPALRGADGSYLPGLLLCLPSHASVRVYVCVRASVRVHVCAGIDVPVSIVCTASYTLHPKP